MHSQYIFKAISRIFSWSIVKHFEPRNCFWDSVGKIMDSLLAFAYTLPVKFDNYF